MEPSDPSLFAFSWPLCLSVTLPLFGACVAESEDWDAPGVDSVAGTAQTSAGETSGSSMADGDGDGDGDGDASGDGDGDGDESGGGDGDGDEDGPRACGESAPALGPCPPQCDSCEQGVCERTCDESECQDAAILGPSEWPFRLICAGKDACKTAEITCQGEGSCELFCEGDKACEDALLACAGGPCAAYCEADAFDKPCNHLETECGSNDTVVYCEDGTHAYPPEPSGAMCSCGLTCESEHDD